MPMLLRLVWFTCSCARTCPLPYRSCSLVPFYPGGVASLLIMSSFPVSEREFHVLIMFLVEQMLFFHPFRVPGNLTSYHK